MPDQLPDDGRVGVDELLYRRVRSDQISLAEDGSGYRPTSAALRSSGGPLSVDVASLSNLEQVRDALGLRLYHVAVISARVARVDGCNLRLDPDESGNPAHAHIYGRGPDGCLNKGQAYRIASQ